MDNQYYKEETPVNQLQYSSPDPHYYGSSPRRSQKAPCDPNGYYSLHHLTQQTYNTGTCEVEGKEFYDMGTDILVRKPDLLKVEKPERDDKITDNK